MFNFKKISVIRKNKNKIKPNIEDREKYDTGTSSICCEEVQPPRVHHGTPYIVDIKLRGPCSNSINTSEEPNMVDFFEENLIDTEVLVKSSDKNKQVGNVRYSGEYDNVCSNVKF